MLHIVLYQPEIPPNTGNVIRLAANTGFTLHLIKPLGFAIDHAKMRRAGLDYHEFAELKVHETLSEFERSVNPPRCFALSTRAHTRYDAARYQIGDALVFGPETRGLPQELLDRLPPEQTLRLPMRPNNRSLNLSNAVAVVAFEAWRQLEFAGSDR